MPALVMCNRRWKVGSDDFVYSTVFLLLLRLAWICALVGVFCQHTEVFHCTGKELLSIYFGGMLILLLAKVLINLAILMTSMKGSIMFTQPRKNLPYCLLAKLISMIVEILWTALGTYWAFDDSTGCDPAIIQTVKSLVIIGWICTAFAIIGLVLAFDFLGGLSQSDHGEGSKVWQRICRVLCCHPYNDETSNSAFSELALILSKFFLPDNLVPTDIAAGLVILSHQQPDEEDPDSVYLEMSPSPVTSLLTTPDPMATDPSLVARGRGPAQPLPWMTVGNASYFMKYALASYGWPFYVFDHMPSGCCRLCFMNKRGCCLSDDAFPNVEGDNCCHCNSSAIAHTIDLLSIDIAHATFKNTLFESPFFIGVDRLCNTVVISIRGTLSLSDIVTDLTIAGERVEAPLMEGTDCLVHKGMLKTAKRLQEKIESNRYLEQAFEENPDFRLVITGHSLGAGVAALLAILYHSKYPNLNCYSFSPPGCVLNECAAVKTDDFIMSVVVGDDIVPRLGLRSVELLRIDLANAIASTNVPKYKILAHGCFQMCCRKYANCLNNQEDRTPLLGNQQYTPVGQGEDDDDDDDELDRCHHPVTAPKMYLPGQIMVIDVPDDDVPLPADGGATKDISWRWRKKEDFDQIRVTRKMVAHHMPSFVSKCLSQLLEGQSYGS